MGSWEFVSLLIGWGYVFCWGTSFWFQVLLNYRRKSTEGLSINFLALNILGFSALVLYNALFLFSHTVQEQYMQRAHETKPLVRINDLVFAGYAFFMSVTTMIQASPLVGYRKDPGRKINSLTWAIIVGSVVGVGLVAALIPTHIFEALDVVYAASNVKVLYIKYKWNNANEKILVTLTKYVPQALKNYENQSTEGWSIHNILMVLLAVHLLKKKKINK